MAPITDNQRTALNTIVHGYPALSSKALDGRDFNTLTKSEASAVISKLIRDDKRLASGLWPWAFWTKQSVCAQALYEAGGDVPKAMRTLTPSIGRVKALTFQRNVNGTRVPITDHQGQQEALRKQLLAVRDDVVKALAEGGGEQLLEEQQDEPKEQKHKRKGQTVLERIREIRAWCKERAADGHPIDEIGMRPAENAAKMMRAGIPERGIFHAMTMHFPPEARRTLRIQDFDVTSFRQEDRKDGIHAALPYILALISERIPVALVGPKGTGKTTIARQISELLELPFGMVSMTSATSPSAFNGRPKIGGDGGVVQSQFEKIYTGGGIFLFDELDASDENLLLLVNAALANGQFANSATGQIVNMHEDFVPMAGMNTLGLGAGRDYNSRNKLDAATLDRWNMGRVKIDLDERIEESMFYGILETA